MSDDSEIPAETPARDDATESVGGDAPVTEESPRFFSRRIAIGLVLVNVVLLVGSSIAQVNAWNWTDNLELASFVSTVTGMSTAGTIAIVCVIAAWGPGPIWIRSVTLFSVIVLFSITFALVDFVSDRYFAGYTQSYYSQRPWLQLASFVGNSLSLCVPMTMVLILIGAFLRLRLGDPSLGPVRIRIIGLMAATTLLAVLVVANAKIQHLFYQEMFGNVDSEFTSQDNQRIQTMTIIAISAPIAAIVVALAAWSHTSHYAKLIILSLLMGLGLIFVVTGGTDYLSAAALISGAIAAAFWIALNLWCLGKAGWPLTRRAAT